MRVIDYSVRAARRRFYWSLFALGVDLTALGTMIYSLQGYSYDALLITITLLLIANILTHVSYR